MGQKTYFSLYISTLVLFQLITYFLYISSGLPWWVSSKESACQETWVQSLDWGYSSEEEEMATHSGILAWKIPLAEEPGGL